MYVIDTNIFLDWWERRYPPDIFPSVEKAMVTLAANGIIVAPDGVRKVFGTTDGKRTRQAGMSATSTRC